jgi:chromosomal replication initiation ATPase DnaA
MGRQLSFDLPVNVALGVADFFVSDSNADAYAMVTGAVGWPQDKLCLTGPRGSGKSHLARVWQAQTGAAILDAAALGTAYPFPDDVTALAIEDMECLPRAAEEPLFHLHNRLAVSGGRLMLTSVLPPARWDIALPDLASRMQATTMVRLGQPDDRLLAAVLTKLFADRQLSPTPEVVALLVTRMERSFQAATGIVVALDAASLAQQREINATLARDILRRLTAETG